MMIYSRLQKNIHKTQTTFCTTAMWVPFSIQMNCSPSFLSFVLAFRIDQSNQCVIVSIYNTKKYIKKRQWNINSSFHQSLKVSTSCLDSRCRQKRCSMVYFSSHNWCLSHHIISNFHLDDCSIYATMHWQDKICEGFGIADFVTYSLLCISQEYKRFGLNQS